MPLGELVYDAVETKGGVEAGIWIGQSFPMGGFDGVERVIGHDGRIDPCELQDAGEVASGILIAEEIAQRLKGWSREGRDPAPAEWRRRRGLLPKWGIFDEQGLPDDIGSFLFVQNAVVCWRYQGEAKEFGFQVVIGQDLIDA